MIDFILSNLEPASVVKLIKITTILVLYSFSIRPFYKDADVRNITTVSLLNISSRHVPPKKKFDSKPIIFPSFFLGAYAVATSGSFAFTTYTSDYISASGVAGMDWASAKAICDAQGSGYSIATFPTNASALYGATNFFSSWFWVGANDIAVEGEWRWAAGRLSGLQFNAATQTLSYFYNPNGALIEIFSMAYWNPGEPNDSSSNEDCMCINGVKPSANDLNCATVTSTTYVCERSACRMGTDCSLIGAASMSGSYYPNCACACNPGYKGPKCDIAVYAHPHGMYTSEYTVTCPSYITFNEARATCRSRGSGWEIASFPTNASYASFFTLLKPYYKSTFMGADDLDIEGMWQWTAGRLKSLVFLKGKAWAAECLQYMYQPHGYYRTVVPNNECRFSNGEPNDSSGIEDVAVSNSYTLDMNTWNDLRPDPTNVPCVACERSACVFGTDCVAATTLSMSGDYYPNCVCSCKPGYAGSKCEIAIVDHGPYTSEYEYVCPFLPMTHAEAQADCRSRGNGYDLATFPTPASAEAYQPLLAKAFGRAWYGATDGPNEGTWFWTTGRLSGMTYYVNGTCTGVDYRPLGTTVKLFPNCSWKAAEPNGARVENCGDIVVSTMPFLNDANCTAKDPCYTCERSPCKLGTDCNAAGTASMIGDYFPNCVCNCKSGFSGPKCDVLSVDHGLYVSEYDVVCDSGRNFASAQAACRGRGSGYDLATFPTFASVLAFQQAFFAPWIKMWVGASDAAEENKWIWTGGRLNGMQFTNNVTCLSYEYRPINSTGFTTFNECPWTVGEPNGKTIENCGEFNKASGTAILNDVRCSVINECYTCERSPCKLDTDCVAATTLSMSGDYYPNCVCTCKPGYTGSKCERLVVSNAVYTSEYDLTCTATPRTFSESHNVCKSRGGGWDMATFPNLTTTTAFLPLDSAPFTRAYIAASDASDESKWIWTAGRLSGLQFTNNTSCISHEYRPISSTTVVSFDTSQCPWAAGEPNGGTVESCGSIYSSAATYAMNDVSCNNKYTCVACERSPCKLGTDCDAATTLSMSGDYYPNCVCTCKPGYTGSKCEIAVVDHGPYVSHYTLTCTAAARNWSTSAGACATRGAGWDLATLPTSLSFSRLSIWMAPFLSMWLGASDSVTEGTWLWTSGRLAGVQFAQTSVCKAISFASFNATDNAFGFCPWATAAGQPVNVNGKEDCLQGLQGALTAAECPNTLSCFACERSPCRINTDCYEPNTASMTGDFFPNCLCTCKPGASGSQCEWPLVVRHNGLYSSEYRIVQSSGGVAYTGASSLCSSSLGPEWTIASIASANATALLRRRLSGVLTPLWVGARDPSANGLWRWEGGRLTGRGFFTKATPGVCPRIPLLAFEGHAAFVSNCPWVLGKPAGFGTCGVLSPSDPSTTAGILVSDVSCASSLRGVVCERTLCEMGLDCHPINTKTMTGYYPSCQCVCKLGAYGARCQYPYASATPTSTSSRSLSSTRSLTATKTVTTSLTATSTTSLTTTLSLSSTITATMTSSGTRSSTTTTTVTSSSSATASTSLTTTLSSSTTITAPVSSSSSIIISPTGSLTATRTTTSSLTTTSTTSFTTTQSLSSTITATMTSSATGSSTATGTVTSSSSATASTSLSTTLSSSTTITAPISSSSSIFTSPTGSLTATRTLTSSSSATASTSLSSTQSLSTTINASMTFSRSTSLSATHSLTDTTTATSSPSATASTSLIPTMSTTPSISGTSSANITSNTLSLLSSPTRTFGLSPTSTPHQTTTVSSVQSPSSSVQSSQSILGLETDTQSQNISTSHSSKKSATFSVDLSESRSIQRSNSLSSVISKSASVLQTLSRGSSSQSKSFSSSPAVSRSSTSKLSVTSSEAESVTLSLNPTVSSSVSGTVTNSLSLSASKTPSKLVSSTFTFVITPSTTVTASNPTIDKTTTNSETVTSSLSASLSASRTLTVSNTGSLSQTNSTLESNSYSQILTDTPSVDGSGTESLELSSSSSNSRSSTLPMPMTESPLASLTQTLSESSFASSSLNSGTPSISAFSSISSSKSLFGENGSSSSVSVNGQTNSRTHGGGLSSTQSYVEVSPTLHHYPTEFVQNAPPEVFQEMSLAADHELHRMTLVPGQCDRIESILVSSALLTPFLSLATNYREVHLINLACFGLILILGVIHVFLHMAFDRCRLIIDSKETNKDGRGFGNKETHDTLLRKFGRSATLARFPATAIDCLAKLSLGSAVAAGVGIGGLVRDRAIESSFLLDIYYHGLCAILLLVFPVASIIAVRYLVDASAKAELTERLRDNERPPCSREREIDSDDDGKKKNNKGIISESEDDSLELNNSRKKSPKNSKTSPKPAAPRTDIDHGRRRIETAEPLDADLSSPDKRYLKIVKPFHSYLFLCSVVRPRRHALRFGPLVGDLRFQSLLSPAIPFILPLFLFLASLLCRILFGCAPLPLAFGSGLAFFSLFVVLGLRPYLGFASNLASFFVTLVAAAGCFGWWANNTNAFSSLNTSESRASQSILLSLAALSNCRYPFILARALDIVFPAVTKVVRNPCITKEQKEAKSPKHRKPDTPNDASRRAAYLKPNRGGSAEQNKKNDRGPSLVSIFFDDVDVVEPYSPDGKNEGRSGEHQSSVEIELDIINPEDSSVQAFLESEDDSSLDFLEDEGEEEVLILSLVDATDNDGVIFMNDAGDSAEIRSSTPSEYVVPDRSGSDDSILIVNQNPLRQYRRQYSSDDDESIFSPSSSPTSSRSNLEDFL